jgi:hypothetical protein
MCRAMLCLNPILMSGRSPTSSAAKIACASTINNIAKEHMFTLFPEGLNNDNNHNITSTDFANRYSKYLTHWKNDVCAGLSEHINYGFLQDFSEFSVSSRDRNNSLTIIRTLNANDVHGSQEILEAITSAINAVVRYVTI